MIVTHQAITNTDVKVENKAVMSLSQNSDVHVSRDVGSILYEVW